MLFRLFLVVTTSGCENTLSVSRLDEQLVAVEDEPLVYTCQAVGEHGQPEEAPRQADAVKGEDQAQASPQQAGQTGQRETAVRVTSWYAPRRSGW